MAKSKKTKIYNFILILVIALLIIPQTRKPIQVLLNKGLVTIIKPSVVKDSDRTLIAQYNWQLKDNSGNHFDFNSVKGKIVVINFWATWCPPCIAEMSSLQSLYNTYQDTEEIVFLFISNEKSEVINKFMNKNGFKFPVYKPIDKYPSEFNVTSIPRTFILSKTGEIVIDKTGPADWNSKRVIFTIDELLKVF